MPKEKEIQCMIALKVKATVMTVVTLFAALTLLNYLKNKDFKTLNSFTQKIHTKIINS